LGDLEHGAFIANNPNISDTDKRNIFSESVKQFLKL
jgi:hypothetical protein